MTPREDIVKLLPALRAFAISLCGDGSKADDLVQEAIVKALANLDKYQDGSNLRAWMFTILRNAYFSDLRKRRPEVEDVDGTYSAGLSAPAPQLGKVMMRDMRDALRLLPDDQREAVLLVGAAGFSYEEAAAIAGSAVGTVKSRVSRARARLEEILAPDPDEQRAAPDAPAATGRAEAPLS